MGTKREEQKRKREQKQQEAVKRQQRNRLLGRMALFVGLPLLLIALVYGLMSQGPVYSPVELSDNDHIRGSGGEDSPLLVVYADFQRPACANEHELMQQAWSSIAPRARLVFRHFPLSASHPHAWEAALFAETAGRQGKFWEMHDLLFANQPYWSSLSDATSEFEAYLQQLDLDMEQARVDLQSDEVAQKVRSDQRGGNRAGVRSTPTIFVDGEMAPLPRSARDIVQLVDEAEQS